MVAVDKLLKYAEAHRGGAHQGYDQSRRDAQRNSAVHGSPAAECDRPHYEEKLAELILQMKAEIAALRSGASTEYPDGVSPKKKAVAAYLREHPGVTNKAKIARDLNMDRTTVQRYYDEIRAELRGEESPAPQT